MNTVAIAMLVKNEAQRIENIAKNYNKSGIINKTIIFDDYSTDNTVELLEKYNFTVMKNCWDQTLDDFAKKRNKIMSILSKYKWILFVDADEVWDQELLKNISEICNDDSNKTLSYAFRRINMPYSKNYPDYQVRLIKNNSGIYFKGKIHEKVFSQTLNIPVLETVTTPTKKCNDQGFYYCDISKYNIIHLKRRNDIKRKWW